MKTVTIYHNPRCSKSRQCLELLIERGFEPTVVHYLDNPLTEQDIQHLLQLLQATPRDLIRKSEEEYRDNYLRDELLTDEQLIQALLDFPILLQRPIVVVDDKACIGRPPEMVLELLQVSE